MASVESDLTVKVEIRCPACNKRGVIKVSDNLVNKNERGITAVNVAEDLVCEHSFVAYIDKNLEVRDCFICDFRLVLPKIGLGEEKKEIIPKDFDIDILKFNIIPSLMVYILKGIIYGKKIVIISELGSLYKHFINFFNYLMKDTFKSEIGFLSESEYRDEKKEYKDHIVLQNKDIINGKDKIFNPKNTKIESSIIQNFFGDSDPELALIKFKNEILKLFKISQDLLIFNNNLKEDEEFFSKKALDFSTKNIIVKFQTVILFYYLKL
ncbi:MAG TPA: hypothetical protein VGB37_01675 [Candidatus Lokiarchaeia archaeon]